MGLLPLFITARKRSLGQGNIFRSVCREFCPHGGSTWAGTPLSRYTSPGRVHLLGMYPLAGTPPGRYPPQAGTPPGRYTPPREVHAGRYRQQAGGTHPTGMLSY